ncbi:Transcription factor bHLH94 [Triticum urartu]|uniref:Transcription factor bHLH94 n=1 Tax=Triticum urartu TaxID=4572 RepID=M7YPX6_TRIUA|nr:Transcription factor bHLH94 [Triticum urartu]
MTLDALCAAGDVLVYDTFNAAAAVSAAPAESSLLFCDVAGAAWMAGSAAAEAPAVTIVPVEEGEKAQGRRKRRRRARSCKNREDAESQRMTHIAVERNRRRQMNEYLAVLRSLMPESYAHRVEEGCGLTTADDIAAAEGCGLTPADAIAAAVHHVLCLVDAEATSQRLLAGGQQEILS